ncbi:MAG TPA: DNA-formamidopyrimidine glycosylase family protein [Candidatus Dependentiae bacterium]|nr:DNA-formamidopyrimidine glycosylase family protein [Candidatus Dependentiae bacterium]HRQ62892.1 DNA-formamidopyrimidine glycosylase family protein [Candidatus Dependentiae bacterium]
MPELPELAAFKSYLEHTCLHKKITDVTAHTKTLVKKTSFSTFKKTLVGKAFTSVESDGKYLIIHASGTIKKVVMHFGLTGTLFYIKNIAQKVKYSQVSFIFGKQVLHWIDRRKFGKIWFVEDVQSIPALRTLGPNPLKISQKQFLDIIENHATKNIKILLMDQKIIAGIGNEYSDEILFQAGVDPHHKARDLTVSTIKKIYTKMETVLRYAIKLRKKQVNKLDGNDFFAPEYRKEFKNSYLIAHRHMDNLCPKNKNHKLKKVTIGGRSAYYCPKDQT